MSETSSRADLIIRPSEDRDIPAIQSIYAHHVLHGLASFEVEPPDEAEIARRRAAVLDGGFPYFVAERDGEVLGYTYAGPYRARPAYRFTAENSIYIRHDCIGQGIGGRLLAVLIAACEERNLRQLIAVIGDTGNTASLELHRRAGFETIGTIRAVGHKFGRWVDSVMMQRSLGPGDAQPP